MNNKTFLLLAVMLLAISSGFAGELLENGNFDIGRAHGFWDGGINGWGHWGSEIYQHVDNNYHYGNFGIAMWGTDSGLVQVEQCVPGDKFTLSGSMVYPSGGEALTLSRKGYLKLEFWSGPNPTGVKLHQVIVGSLGGSDAADTWNDYSGSGTAPVGTTEVRVVAHVFGTGAGKCYFDNISLDDSPTVNSPDYDDSLSVNFADFAKLAGVWGKQSSVYNLAGSEFIDVGDLAVMANAWLFDVPVYPGYTLAWSDEFYGSQIDSGNWTHEIGTGSNGWGNQEWQYYTDRSENSRIENGMLVIEAKKENFGGSNYTSARLKTQGKRSFTYGKIEARMKMPTGGNGIWPAFWMLGDNITTVGWPQCGELDILEMMEDPYTAIGAIHYGSSDPYIPDNHVGSYTSATNLSDDFHVYGVEWDETRIRWYRDGVTFHVSANSWAGLDAEQEVYPAPFDKDFFILLNFAVGAHWATEDPNLQFPQKFYIDYVRVYQKTTP